MRRSAMMRQRVGFTLVEIVVAVSLTLAVFAITLPFVRAQTRGLGSTAARLDAEQIARYAQRAIDKELRLAVADADQSLIVYAGTMGIAFNANLVARDTSDPNALEVDADADSSVTEAWRVANASTLPLSTETYPAVDYVGASGVASRNETIAYFLHPDTVSHRADIYVLWRRVNAGDSVLIVRGIHVPDDSAFFSYQTMSGGTLTSIAAAALPMYWDTTAIADIRAVTLRSAGYYRNSREDTDIFRTVYWTTFLPNASPTSATCATAPATPPASNASQFDVSRTNNAYPYRVEIDFSPSTDDAGASGTVTHYVIERKLSAASTWVQIATVPARRATSYTWTDVNPTLIGTVVYGVRAVNCGGLSSGRATRSSVSLPT